VHQLRLLFLQLYKTDAPAVRPDEELAYLAITRPEIDELVEPEVLQQEPGSLIDNLPNVGSPSSTCVNTPNVSRPSSPLHRELSASRSSVLGKRVSQDRDTSRSPGDRPKKSDGFERLREEDHPSEAEHDFEMVDAPEEEKSKPIHQEFAERQSVAMTDPPSSAPSTTADMDIDRLKLKSPEIDQPEEVKTDYAPPPGPPPLPPRPRRASKGTLNAGLKFGKPLTAMYRLTSRSTTRFGRGSNQCAFAAGDRL
jgi:ubiquitin carboxyl-terminal hydrolase 25/28